MALVSYSDSGSDSESEAPQPIPAPKPTAPAGSARLPTNPKKPTVQKLIDRSNPGKIVVNLSRAADTEAATDGEPPAKRARTGPAGGAGPFSGFNSFLPPPKNPKGATGASSGGNGTARFRPGINLKTSAEPAFRREAARADGDVAEGTDDDGEGSAAGNGTGSVLVLPPLRAETQSSVPPEEKRADEVKPVGNRLMFKPLSVSRKTTKKKIAKQPNAQPATTTTTTTTTMTTTTGRATSDAITAAPESDAHSSPAPRVSLFSTYTEPEPEPDSHEDARASVGAYEPLFTSSIAPPPKQDRYAEAAHIDDPYLHSPTADQGGGSETLDSIADSLNLSSSARRELFGRQKRGRAGAGTTEIRVVNMENEYAQNAALLASGEARPSHQPVRGIQPGKHSVRQIVNMVQNQRDALEESFSRGKHNKREAGSRYGW